MNDMVATKAQDTLTFVMIPKLAAMIGTRAVEYHQGQRSYAAPKAGTYDHSLNYKDRTVENPLAKEAVHI